MKMRTALLFLSLLLAGCGGAPPFSRTVIEEEPPAPKADGAFYLDDGPPDIAPADLADIPDAVPKAEKIVAATTRPYTALGKRWTPHREVRPHRERGIASWYGKRYHGRPTASGEIYDMFLMTAAHPVLAIPSYARVTRTDNGKSAVVRINDRGPFLRGRVIDLSYAAAVRLGIAEQGAAEVVVEAIVPDGAEKAEFPAPETPPAESSPAPSSPEQVYIQLGAFAESANAERMQKDLRGKGPAGLRYKIHFRDGLFLFLAGPYPDEAAARGDDGALCAAGWCGFFTRAP